MPNNVCNVFITPLPGEKSVKKYITKAERKMQAVCEEIKNGVIKKRGFNLGSRALGLIQGVFYPVLEKIGADRVWIGDSCARCNLCVSVCPMNLIPTKLATSARSQGWETFEKYHPLACVECGCCTYGCPATIPIVQLIRVGKIEMNKQKKPAG